MIGRPIAEPATLANVRIFVSSTTEDLTQYREAVFAAIQELGGGGEDMLYWPADERRPLDVCLQRIRASDLVILILAHRYGFVPKESSYSITELEFRAAQDGGIPVLGFLVDDD